MLTLDMLPNLANTASPAPLANPQASLLGRHLESRLHAEKFGTLAGPLPKGVRIDLRPTLPKIGMATLSLYLRRKKVDSYPMLFTTLALAHPN